MERNIGNSIKATSLGLRRFNVSDSNSWSYRHFISNFGTYEGGNGILNKEPILSQATKPTPLLPSSEDEFKYFDVRFFARDENGQKVSVDCRFSADSLYFIGFRNTGTWYFLKDWMPKTKGGEKIQVTGLDEFSLLHLGCSYRQLEKDLQRSELTLGKFELIQTVLALSRFQEGQNQNGMGRHYLKICQIFCEAIRIGPILDEIFVFYDKKEGGKLSSNSLEMQNDWAKNCKFFSQRIFNEMLPFGSENINITEKDLEMAGYLSTIKRIGGVIYEKYQVGLTIGTTSNREHNRTTLTKKLQF